MTSYLQRVLSTSWHLMGPFGYSNQLAVSKWWSMEQVQLISWACSHNCVSLSFYVKCLYPLVQFNAAKAKPWGQRTFQWLTEFKGGGKRGEVLLQGDNKRGFLWNDGPLLYLDYGGGSMILGICQNITHTERELILWYVCKLDIQFCKWMSNKNFRIFNHSSL